MHAFYLILLAAGIAACEGATDPEQILVVSQVGLDLEGVAGYQVPVFLLDGGTVRRSPSDDVYGEIDGLRWAVDDTAIVRVASARLTGVAAGSTELEVTNGRASARAAVHVGLPPLGATTVSVGGAHACAMTYPTLACWGSNWYGEIGQGDPVPFQTYHSAARVSVANPRSLDAGERHSCASVTDRILCWGDNSYRQLGVDGSSTGEARSRSVPGVQLVALGAFHSCAVVNKQLECWGRNHRGQIGSGTSSAPTAPLVVDVGGDVTSVALGAAHTCVTRADDRVLCWGWNGSGQLGNGAGADRNLPTLVDSVSLLRVSAGYRHSCGLTAEGHVYCWGDGAHGQLGPGLAGGTRPALVTLPFQAVDLALGDHHSCALASTGQVYCWGWDPYGEATGAPSGGIVPPTPVPLGFDAIDIDVGPDFSCAADGLTVRCWGANHLGQMGNGKPGATSVPLDVLVGR